MFSNARLILSDHDAFSRIGASDVEGLTEAATAATFYRDGLSAEQVAANRRVVEISGPTAVAAAVRPNQHFAAAFSSDTFAGFVIATRHDPDDLELDWLMVHPDFHGTGVAAGLMKVGIDWLGPEKPIWLNVIRFNERAIAFYRRFGFEIDPDTDTGKVVPNWVMRRPAGMPREPGG